MKNAMTNFTLILMVLAVGGVAHGVLVDIDSVADGTDISTFFSGITLSTNVIADSSVFARDDSRASTDFNVFGNYYFNNWIDKDSALKVEFGSPVELVSIDAIASNGKDYGRLEAYSSFGKWLATYNTSVLNVEEVETMTISRSTADIAYIIAGGRYGGDSAVLLDNLNYIVPEPATLAILTFGSLMFCKR